MHRVDHLRTLYSFHFDTTFRLISSAENLTEPADTGQPEEGQRSIRDLLLHLLDTDRGWRTGLETGKRPERLRREDYLELAALRRGFESERSAWEAFLANLDDALIDDDIELKAGPNRVFSFGRWKVLHHVLLHGMQHHAEIAQQLTQAGESPGDIDFIFYA
jgi:uncharacterized damage-inducible protein DinB